MARSVECPHCHSANAVPQSNIGQYVTCESCRCKFYVYVPPAKEAADLQGRVVAPPTPRGPTPPADQSEHSMQIRQEALLAEIHEDLIDLRRRLTIACILLVIAAAVVTAVIIWD